MATPFCLCYPHGENYDYFARRRWSESPLRNFDPALMSVSVLTIFALPNIFLAPRSPGPSTATFSFPGGGTFIKTPVNSAVRRSREAPTTGRGLRFIQCYRAQARAQGSKGNIPRENISPFTEEQRYLFRDISDENGSGR